MIVNINIKWVRPVNSKRQTTSLQKEKATCWIFIAPRAEMKQPSGHVLLIADPQEQEQNKLREHVECLWSVTFTDVQLVKAKQWAKLISKGV